MFNALRYTRKLEEVGFSREQAETHIQIITEIVEGDLATKQDLKSLESNLQHSIQQLELRLIIKIGTMMTVSVAVLATILKLLEVI